MKELGSRQVGRHTYTILSEIKEPKGFSPGGLR